MTKSEMRKKKVLFICTHNSARSQMAEGFMNRLLGEKYQAFSAGTEPSTLNPLAVRVMAELGIDISGQRSKSINEFRGELFDVVVTVCDHAKETCPFFPGKVILHKGFEDPSPSGDIEVFRKVRDEIKNWILENFS